MLVTEALGRALYLAFAMFWEVLWRRPTIRTRVWAAHREWDYNALLNLAVLAVSAVLGWRFLTTGGARRVHAPEVSSTSPSSDQDRAARLGAPTRHRGDIDSRRGR